MYVRDPGLPILTATAALLGFWFTQLAVGVTLLAVQRMLLGQLAALPLFATGAAAFLIAAHSTGTAAIQLRAVWRDDDS